MKTLKRTNPKTNEIEFRRIDDDSVDQAIERQGWSYCPKSEWKSAVRDLNKKSETEKPKTKDKKTKKD
jgi:hypothetical protein